MSHQLSKKFTLKMVLMVAIQMIDRIKWMHSKGYIHRDIKPENFLIGASEQDQHVIYMIDFGLTRKFQDPRTQKHIPCLTVSAS
jgi:serine/threonine protein kinase